jgi:hypothetical protein
MGEVLVEGGKFFGREAFLVRQTTRMRSLILGAVDQRILLLHFLCSYCHAFCATNGTTNYKRIIPFSRAVYRFF